jgi:ABC-type transport system involved in cytochrome bd biosynthesis fused ATPase/permease subunit
MDQQEQCDNINHHTDERLHDMENRFDKHLLIYANNGKELQGVKEQMQHMREDMRDLSEQIKDLLADKNANDMWKVFFIKTVAGSLIFAALLAIGVKLS